MEDLTAENVLYWRCLCEYLKSKGEEGEVLLEQVLPEPAIYADYLLRYIAFKNKSFTTKVDFFLENISFIQVFRYPSNPKLCLNRDFSFPLIF